MGNEKIWMLEEMERAIQNGIPVKVDGKYYDTLSPQELTFLQEEESYMQDYFGDEKGKIVEIAFDKVRIKNN